MRTIGMLFALSALIVVAAIFPVRTDTNVTSVWDENDIVSHMGLTPNRSGYSWSFEAPGGTSCNVAVVMTSARQVDMYQDAGDVVATNPGGTAGVKITGVESRTCQDAANELLIDLE